MNISDIPEDITAHFDIDFINPIGKGSYGTVYKAISYEHPNKQFALKMQRSHSFSKYQQYIKEINNLQKLGQGHPNIISIHHITHFKIEEEYFLAILMEKGQYDLNYLIEQQRKQKIVPSAYNILEYMRQINEALIFLKSKELYHCDLKPSNIMVQPGALKLVDFGLSKSIQDNIKPIGNKMTIEQEPNIFPLECILKKQRQLCGTPNYFSPEQKHKNSLLKSKDPKKRKEGEKMELDQEKSEIYSLGVIMLVYFMKIKEDELYLLTEYRIQVILSEIENLHLQVILYLLLHQNPKNRPTFSQLRFILDMAIKGDQHNFEKFKALLDNDQNENDYQLNFSFNNNFKFLNFGENFRHIITQFIGKIKLENEQNPIMKLQGKSILDKIEESINSIQQDQYILILPETKTIKPISESIFLSLNQSQTSIKSIDQQQQKQQLQLKEQEQQQDQQQQSQKQRKMYYFGNYIISRNMKEISYEGTGMLFNEQFTCCKLGQFINSQFMYGQEIYANGQIYDGAYANGQKHGQVIHYNPRGFRYKYMYTEGKLDKKARI